MRFQLRHFFGLAVSVLFVFCVSYGTGNDARAQTGPKTISVFPANASETERNKVIAGADADSAADDVSCGLTGTRKSPMACTVQELVDLADPGDTVMFMPAPSGDDPNVYDDVGEILITRNGDDSATAAPAVETITIRGMGSGDDMITFTGKVMFNVKTSNIVIRGFKFKDTEPPDTATMRATAGTTARAATKTVEYGLSGRMIAAFLHEVDSVNWAATDTLAPHTVIANEGLLINDGLSPGFAPGSQQTRNFFWNDHLFVTIPTGRTGAGQLSTPPGGQITRSGGTGTHVIGEAFPVSSALNAMGTVWIDSASSSNTETCADGGARTNVQVRNNVFENTYLAGVRAGNHSWQGDYRLRATAYKATATLQDNSTSSNIAGNSCTAQVEVIGNTFTDVGGNGPFLKIGDSPLVDGNMNKIADVGNFEAAISFSNVTSTGTGATAVSSKISHNTISGGTYDAIIVMNTPANAKIEITRNNIAGSILNGIHILGSGGTGPTISTADITVEGNRIWGGSSNRFLTKIYGAPDGYDEAPHSRISVTGETNPSTPPNSGRGFFEHVAQSCKGFVQSHTDFADASNAFRKNLMPEVWKSNVPNFPWDPSGVPKSLINDAGALQFNIIGAGSLGSGNRLTRTAATSTLSAIDLIRYRADRCYDLGRIRVVNQKGVTIKNNDLGYQTDASGVSSQLSPDNGVVMMGTGVVPKSFEGNNIAFYKEFAVLSDASFSAAKNYLGAADSWRVDSDGSVTGVDNNGGEPFETSDEREIGPDPDVAMPDEVAPELVESGDGAPAVSESGLMLTLTFNDMLDAESVPAAAAFTVMAGAGATIDVAGVRISGNSVILTLGSASAGSGVRDGETVTVSYAKPDSNPITDDAGLELESFSNVSVTNNSTAAAPGTDDGDDGDDPSPGAASTDGGCALASAGSGVDLGALLLLLGAVSFAFGLGRKARAE